MSHKKIRSLYEQRLAEWANQQNLRVAYESVAFEPADRETYFRTFTLPAGTDTQTLRGDDRVFTGVFQVNIVGPSGSGTGAAEDLVEELDELFPAFLRIRNGQIEVMVLTPIEQGPDLVDGGILTVPASFQYRATRG